MGDKSKTAMAIIRVSSHHQKDNTSKEVQESDIRQYCQKNGLVLEKVHFLVESAKKSADRKKYKAVMKEVLSKKVKHLLFYMFDRESRNLTDNEANEELVRDGVLEIHYVRENKVFNKNSPISDFFMRDIHAASSRQFVRTLSAKVTDAMTKKAEDGWFPNNHVPLGYVHQKLRDEYGRERKRGTIIVQDPDIKNIKWVSREFELRAQGMAYADIRNTVVNEGLVPSNCIVSYKANTVHKRVTNPFYYGRFRWQGKEYEGKHGLIIPDEILQKVSKTFGNQYSRAEVQIKSIFANGWMRCAEPSCGCQIIYDPKVKVNKRAGTSKEFRYYHCTNGKRVHKTMRGMNATEEKIWAQFAIAVDSINVSKELADQIAKALNEEGEKESGEGARHEEILKHRLKELADEEDGLYQEYKRGLIEEDQFLRLKEKSKLERISCQRQLQGRKVDQAKLFRETAQSILELASIAKSLWLSRSPRERRDFLDLILSNPMLDGTTVRYELKKPFCVLSEMNQKEDWRSQGDSNPCILREREVS